MAIKSSLQNIKPLTSRLRYGEGSVTPEGLDIAQELTRVVGSSRYADSRTMYKGAKGVQFGTRLEALQNALTATMGEQEGGDLLTRAMNPMTRGDKTVLASLVQRIYDFKKGGADVMKPAAVAGAAGAAGAAGVAAGAAAVAEPPTRRMITRNVNGTVISGFEGPRAVSEPEIDRLNRTADAAAARQREALNPRQAPARTLTEGTTVRSGAYSYWTPVKPLGASSRSDPTSEMFGLSPGLDRELNLQVNRAVSEARARQIAASVQADRAAVASTWGNPAEPDRVWATGEAASRRRQDLDAMDRDTAMNSQLAQQAREAEEKRIRDEALARSLNSLGEVYSGVDSPYTSLRIDRERFRRNR